MAPEIDLAERSMAAIDAEYVSAAGCSKGQHVTKTDNILAEISFLITLWVQSSNGVSFEFLFQIFFPQFKVCVGSTSKSKQMPKY